MTFGYYPPDSVPISSLQSISPGAILANNTNVNAPPAGVTGFYPPSTVTATSTLSYTGAKTNVIVGSSATAPTSQTLPTPTSNNIGAEIIITNQSSFPITINAPSGCTIDGQTFISLTSASSGSYPSVTLVTDSTTSFIIS